MARGYCDGPFGQIHYRIEGQGVPLVLCHQAPMSQRQFDAVYHRLAQRGVQAIGFDLPGYGQSDPPDFEPRIEDYAAVIAPLLDHLDLPAAHFLGHHTGAQVVTQAALDHPDRTLSLILNGPVPMSKEERQAAMAWVEESEKGYSPKPDGTHLMELFKLRTQFANTDTDWALATRYVIEPLMALGPFWYGHNAAFHYDHAAAIKNLAVPTLILTNTGDQIYELAKMTHQMRPDFAYAELEGGGIDIVDEKPEAWTEAVAEFVIGAQC